MSISDRVPRLRVARAVALAAAMGIVALSAGAQPLSVDVLEPAFDAALSPSLTSFDDALQTRIAGTLVTAPAARTAQAVRARLAPGRTLAARAPHRDRGQSAAQRPSECAADAHTRENARYWDLRALVPMSGMASLAPPGTTGGQVDRVDARPGAPSGAWCEPGPRPALALEPAAHAIWGPLLVLALGTFAFWATRGFRSP